MGRGRGQDQRATRGGDGRRSSLNADSPYARPLTRRRSHEHPEGFGIAYEVYEHAGRTFELLSASPPFELGTERVFEDHDVYTEGGAWIGADRPVPHRRLTNSALAALEGAEITDLFARYAGADYGEGECGFAAYETRGGERVWLVDDATRSLEGDEPLRDPASSPGPQTLMLPSDY